MASGNESVDMGSPARYSPNLHHYEEDGEYNAMLEIEQAKAKDHVSGTQTLKRKEISKRSWAGDHYIVFTDKFGKQRARCKYCNRTYDVDPSKDGNSKLNNHVITCKKHPDNVYARDNHTIQIFCQSVTGELREVSSHWKFHQESIRNGLCKMLIIDELPFKFVENEGFRLFMSLACPQFVIPSRSTIIRDCYKLYFDEKMKLKNYFSKTCQRISLTTDTWISNQRITFMCLTAHYIDDDWKLHKLILNFIPCPSHKGDEVGQLIEKCLCDWEIDRVFTITIDDDSSNDTAVPYIRNKLNSWGKSILGGQYLHMRCVAHIIDLVVRDELKQMSTSVERVRTVVRYVIQSPMRLKKFNDFAIEKNVNSKKSLCLDVLTRWNSVFLMLQTGLIFQCVFERYEMCDSEFRSDFANDGPHGKIGLPTKYDWIVVERLVKMLQHFYDLTLRVSSSLFVTSNTFLDEISDVDDLLKEWSKSDDIELIDMSNRIRSEFDKCWGNVENMNVMLYIAVMLDPRYKFTYVLYVLKQMYGSEVGIKIGETVMVAFRNVFEEYKNIYASEQLTLSHSSGSKTQTAVTYESESQIERKAVRAERKRYLQMIFEIESLDKSELDVYLNERIEKDSPDFSLIDWWKLYSPQFPILSKLTRDVLAMPLSTMTSESAFSTEGRIIDNFTASLTPKLAQALICGQDWLRHGPTKSPDEDYEFINRIEEGKYI